MSEGPPTGILAGPAGLETAGALAAAMPGATLVSLGWRLGRPAAPRATSPAALEAWLAGRADRPAADQPTATGPRPRRAAALPAGAALIVCGLAPWVAAIPKLQARRPDLRVVALAERPTAGPWPEHHPPGAAAAARGAFAAMAAGAALVVVPEHGIADELGTAGRGGRPILVEPLPSWLARSSGAAGLPWPDAPLMVACGPIEARANTLLLLHLWRDGLARGAAVPKLVLAGPRGRQVEEIAPLLDWNAALRPLVAEAPGLAPAALRRLVESARAVLVPDFADPPAELMRDLLVLGVRVIAADTPVARRLGLTPRLDPLDGPGWREAIADAAGSARTPGPHPSPALPDWPGYAMRLLAAIRALP